MASTRAQVKNFRREAVQIVNDKIGDARLRALAVEMLLLATWGSRGPGANVQAGGTR